MLRMPASSISWFGMGRRRLAIVAAIVFLGLCRVGAAETYARADLPRIAAQIYLFMSNYALTINPGTTSGNISTRWNQYVTYARHKSLAVCVDWEASTPQKPVVRSYGMSRGFERTWQADQVAIAQCDKFREGRNCTCVVIDRDEANVLTLPSKFVAKHFR